MVLQLFTERNQKFWNVRVDITPICASVLWSQPKLSYTLLNHTVDSVHQSLGRVRQKLSSCKNCLTICAWAQTSSVDWNAKIMTKLTFKFICSFLPWANRVKAALSCSTIGPCAPSMFTPRPQQFCRFVSHRQRLHSPVRGFLVIPEVRILQQRLVSLFF